MSYPALDIAKYIVTYSIRQNNPVSNLKLQKMLYFAWIEYYKKVGKELFSENICAWQFGPVVPEVYYEFCVYGSQPITQEYVEHLAPEDQCLVDATLDKYLCKSVSELVNRTHQSGKPWALTYRDGAGLRMPIPYSRIIDLECTEDVRQFDALDCGERLAEIAELKDGWYDGEGKAFDKCRLAKLAELFHTNYSLEQQPYLYPTPDGTIQAEWDVGRWRVSLEIEPSSMQGDYYALNLDSDAEKHGTFNLLESDHWRRLCREISALERLSHE